MPFLPTGSPGNMRPAMPGANTFWGLNVHYDFQASVATQIANLKTLGCTWVRTAYEGNDASLNQIISLAQALIADGTGIKLYVTIDFGLQDLSQPKISSSPDTYPMYANEQLSYNYAYALAIKVTTALLPYRSCLMGIGLGNELLSKNSVKLNQAYSGSLISDYGGTYTLPNGTVISVFDITRGCLRGGYDGLKSVDPTIPAGSNAFTFSEFAVIEALAEGVAPDGSTGHPKCNWDWTDMHGYHSWGDQFNAPVDGDGKGGRLDYWHRVMKSLNKPIICTEWNCDANSQSDADAAAWQLWFMQSVWARRDTHNIIGVAFYMMYNGDFAWGAFTNDGTTTLKSTYGVTIQTFQKANPDTRASLLQETISGRTAPFESYLVDSTKKMFQLAGKQVLVNRAVDSSASNAKMLLYYNGVMYYQSHAGTWFSWSGTAFVQGNGDPRTGNFDTGLPSSGNPSPPVVITPTFSAVTNGTSVPDSGTNLIEADTVTTDNTRIFSNGVDFALNIVTRAPAADTLNYSIYDVDDTVVATGSFAVPATPRTTALKINSSKSGYFRISCTLSKAGGAIATRGTQPLGFCTFGVKSALGSVLPAVTYAHLDQHRFGMQGENGNISALNALGANWVLDDRNMINMEPNTDNTFVVANDNLDPFFTQNPNIMRVVRLDGIANRYLPADKAGYVESFAPSNMTYWANYCGRVAAETAKVHAQVYPNQKYNYYQVTWEPDAAWQDTDANFVLLYKNAYTAIHANDPNAYVMGPTDSMVTAANARMQRLASLGIWSYVDGVTTHGYWDAGTFPTHRPEQRGASTDPATAANGMAQGYNTLRTTMNNVRPGMRLFQTEMGVAYEFDMDYGDTRINPNYLYAHGATVAVGATITLGEGADVHFPFFGGDYTKEDNGMAGFGVFFSLDPARTPDYPIGNYSPKPAAMAIHVASVVLDGTTTLGRDKQFNPADNGIHAYWHQKLGGGKCILEAHTFKDAAWQLGAFSNTYTRNATFNVDAAGTSGTIPVIDWMGNVTTQSYTNGQLTLALKQHPQYVVVSNATVAKANATVPVGYVAMT